MKALLKNYRQAPRKVRLVADHIRGKRATEARVLLSALPKRAALPIRKLLDSAIANAKNMNGADAGSLYVKEIRVDAGPTLKRFMPRAFGRASAINKRSSHVSIVLGEGAGKVTARPVSVRKKRIFSNTLNPKP